MVDNCLVLWPLSGEEHTHAASSYTTAGNLALCLCLQPSFRSWYSELDGAELRSIKYNRLLSAGSHSHQRSPREIRLFTGTQRVTMNQTKTK